MREVVAAASTGSLSGLILGALVQALQSPVTPPSAPLNLGPNLEAFCPKVPTGLDLLDFPDNKSFWLGVLCGIAVGPLIDILYGLRVWWRQTTYRWWTSLGRAPTSFPLYRVHEH